MGRFNRMCSITGSKDLKKLKELIELNSYRGVHSHSITVFDPGGVVDTMFIPFDILYQKKGLGPLIFDNHDLSEYKDAYYLVHQQAPTTESKNSNAIHPAIHNDNMLWHNGIIKHKQVEKERRDNDRAHALDRARNVRPTDISDSRQLGSPFKGERKRTSKRDLEARRNNPKPYSALDAGGDNDQPYSHASARGSHTRKGNSRDASPNGGNSVLSQLQKAYGNSNDGSLRRKRPGASSGGTPRTKDGTPRSRDPSPRPQGRDPSPRPQGSTPRDESLLRSRGRSRSRDGTPKQRRSSGRRNGGGSGNGSDFRRSESASSTLRDAGRRSLSSSGQAASYTGF